MTPFRIQKGTMRGRANGLMIVGLVGLTGLGVTYFILASGLPAKDEAWGCLLCLLLPIGIAYTLIAEPIWIEFGDRLTYRDFSKVNAEDWPNVKLAVEPVAVDDCDSLLCGRQLVISVANGRTIKLADDRDEGRQILQQLDAALERAAHEGERVPEVLVSLRKCLLDMDRSADAEHDVAPDTGRHDDAARREGPAGGLCG